MRAYDEQARAKALPVSGNQLMATDSYQEDDAENDADNDFKRLDA